MSEAASTPSLPTGLIPTVLGPLATLPPALLNPAHLTRWYEEHVALVDSLVCRTVKAVSGAPSRRNPALLEQIGKAHDALRASAARIAGKAVPVVTGKNGLRTIPYKSLADARAKVKVLTEELAHAQQQIAALKVGGWRPAFDVMCPGQERLVVEFCREIAGTLEKPGRLPDPVRLLEMAEALYEAERKDRAP